MTSLINVTQGRLAWSIAEIANSTGLSIGFVRKEIRAGRLVARRAGRRVLVLDRDLQLYLGDGDTK
jgi:excisionase family DNA binding protein